MKEIATILRTLQLFAHNCHNLVKGPMFFADHEFLGELYPVYEKSYDSIVERALGLGLEPDLVDLTVDAAQMLPIFNPMKENRECFEAILKLEISLCRQIETYLASTKVSEGTKQLLGTICDESEARMYQIRQRIKR
jgi:DNA-binding ferritin-like protein